MQQYLKQYFHIAALLASSVTVMAGQVPSKQIDSVFSSIGQQDAGCQLAITQNGHPVYQHGYGMANLDYRIGFNEESVFQLASATKAFTALNILILEQEKKLNLDDSVQKYLPDLPEYTKAITLRHLLSHTSGLRDSMTLVVLTGHTYDQTYTRSDLHALINRQAGTDFAPGARFSYSNTNYILLADVVRKVAGEDIATFAKKHIFDPLGMSQTRYVDDMNEVISHRVTGYDPTPTTFHENNGSTYTYGATGVITTVADLTKWNMAFDDKKSPLFPLFEALEAPTHTTDGHETGWALGSLILDHWNEHPTISQAGSWSGFQTEILRVPDQKLSIINLCNRSDAAPGKWDEALLAFYLGPKPEAPSDRPQPSKAPEQSSKAIDASLTKLPGRYFSSELQTEYRIAKEDGKLILYVRDFVFPLEVHGSTLGAGWFTIRPQTNGFTLDTERAKGLVFQRIGP